jgi:hypothetical protein
MQLLLAQGLLYNQIKPRMLITETLVDGKDASKIADEFLGSNAFMAYGRYKKDKLTLLLKGYIGDNMQHLTLPGGYGVASFDSTSGKETYTSYKTYTAAFNLVYGQKWQVGLFAGYGGNLGTNDALYNFGGKQRHMAIHNSAKYVSGSSTHFIKSSKIQIGC